MLVDQISNTFSSSKLSLKNKKISLCVFFVITLYLICLTCLKNVDNYF